jgi:hypothetical protein
MTFDDDEKEYLRLVIKDTMHDVMDEHINNHHKNGNVSRGMLRDNRDLIVGGIITVAGLVAGIIAYLNGGV